MQKQLDLAYFFTKLLLAPREAIEFNYYIFEILKTENL